MGDNDHDCLTNIRFADDVLFFASSKGQLQTKLCDFKRSTKKVRLRIHPGKTKIFSNIRSNIRKEIEIEDIKVEILTREVSTKYLGQMITFQQQETTEIMNRIRAAWATLHKYRQELTSKIYMLRHRLRFFDSVVSPTMKCASGTWTLTKERERMIQSTQRGKIRPMISSTQKTWIALKMKMRMDQVQTRAMIRTVTSLSRTILTKRLTQQRLKKKNGLNT